MKRKNEELISNKGPEVENNESTKKTKNCNEQENKNLVIAIEDRNYEAMKLALINGANPDLIALIDIDKTPKLELSLLSLACFLKDQEIVRILIEYKASVNLQDSRGYTALDYTDYDTGIIKLLIQNGANFFHNKTEENMFFAFVYKQNIEMVEFLLKHTNNDDLPNLSIETGITPLSIAVDFQNMPLTNLLMSYGANFSSEKFIQQKFLNKFKELDYNAVEFILSIKFQETEEMTSYSFEKNMQLSTFFKTRIKSAINVNKCYKEGNTLLHYAIMKSDVKMVKILLENGANYLAKNSNNITPSMLAKKCIEIEELLESVYTFDTMKPSDENDDNLQNLLSNFENNILTETEVSKEFSGDFGDL